MVQEDSKEKEAPLGGVAAAPAGPGAAGAAATLPPGRPASDADSGRGPGDLEMGRMALPCGCAPPAPGQPPSEAYAAWLQERERRTAVHPKRRW